MKETFHVKKHMSSFQVIILGFALVILSGAFLLMLPIATKQRIVTPFLDALFTSTSAVCVTGLVVKDTACYWSLFGQFIILVLIQIGGMGVVSIGAAIAVISGKKISLMQRSTMQEAIAAPKVGGIVRLTSFIVKAILVFELIGAVIMMPVFYKEFGLDGIWMAVFHSVSAFCNAGFDLMGSPEAQFVSITAFADNPLICITIMLLIIIGGIGFLTWEDVYTNRHHVKRYRMQTKVILLFTLVLIVVPTLYFYLFEYQGVQTGKRLLYALFQAVTPRTAGFNTTDLTQFSGAGLAMIIILMLIGGSPGSTAGGMKTTTIVVLFANAISVFRRREDVNCFDRRIEGNVVQHAATVLVMYLTLFLTGAFIISGVEELAFQTCLFETASAVGTVGLTLGITPGLGLVSKLVLIVLMYLGRVGGLTLIYATIALKYHATAKMPVEKITVG